MNTIYIIIRDWESVSGELFSKNVLASTDPETAIKIRDRWNKIDESLGYSYRIEEKQLVKSTDDVIFPKIKGE